MKVLIVGSGGREHRAVRWIRYIVHLEMQESAELQNV